MRDLIINHQRLIQNEKFGIDRNDICGSLFYYNQYHNTNNLLIVHSHGIVNFNVDQGETKRYCSPVVIGDDGMAIQSMCLDVNENIIYVEQPTKRRIVMFNILSGTWKFLDYNMSSPRICYSGNLAFISDPVNEVRFQAFHWDGSYTIFTINKGYLKYKQKKQRNVVRFGRYCSERMDSVYTLRYKLSDQQVCHLEEILTIIFKKRQWKNLHICHVAWNHLVFFVFKNFDRNYIIDCVDIREPMNIFYRIMLIRRIDVDAIFFDHDNNLHHVYITNYWHDGGLHRKIVAKDCIPKVMFQKNKRSNDELIKRYCRFYARKHNLNIPIVLFSKIASFYSVFSV